MKQDLHIFTGKGGVGKSVVALAMAQKLASKGEPTILVELGEHSYFGSVFSRQIGYQPTNVKANLDVALFSGENSLKEYVAHLVKVPRVADLFFSNKVMRAFIRAAPGLNELAILGKLTSGIRKWGPAFKYRHVIVDAFSSGHFLSLLKAPKGLAEVIDMGPMGEQTRSIYAALRNSETVHYHIVTLPEEMPVTESIELEAELHALTNQRARMIVNRQTSFQAEELSASSGWEKNAITHLHSQIEKEKKSMDLLESFDLPIIHLPFVFEVSPQAVAEELSQWI